LPPVVIGGGMRIKGQAVLQLANRSGTPINGVATIRLFLSADGTFDASDRAAGDPAAVKLKLVPGAHKRVAVRLSSLPLVPEGSYHLIAQIERAAATAETVATSATFTVVPPLVDLRASSPALLARGGSATAGKTASASLAVENAGNIPARGKAAVSLFAQPVAGGERVPLASGLPVTLNLKPRGHATVRVKFIVPTGFTPGSYLLVAQLAADALPLAVVQNQGLAMSDTPFTVG
jgi:hypothetical protein